MLRITARQVCQGKAGFFYEARLAPHEAPQKHEAALTRHEAKPCRLHVFLPFSPKKGKKRRWIRRGAKCESTSDEEPCGAAHGTSRLWRGEVERGNHLKESTTTGASVRFFTTRSGESKTRQKAKRCFDFHAGKCATRYRREKNRVRGSARLHLLRRLRRGIFLPFLPEKRQKNGGGRWIRTIELVESRFTVCRL